jgi:putative transposase
MDNHYHALLETSRDHLSNGFQKLNQLHAQRFNERHERAGHLFQARFHARVIRDDEHLANACDYIWANPVRAGMCAEVHHYGWSGSIRLGAGVHRR